MPIVLVETIESIIKIALNEPKTLNTPGKNYSINFINLKPNTRGAFCATGHNKSPYVTQFSSKCGRDTRQRAPKIATLQRRVAVFM